MYRGGGVLQLVELDPELHLDLAGEEIHESGTTPQMNAKLFCLRDPGEMILP